MFQASGLADKAIIITGGTRGIGRATVELFAVEGADVTFFFRESKALANELVAGGRAAGQRITAEQVDVRDGKACEAAVERVVGRCGRIDVLVNNSGVIRDNLLGLLEDDDVKTVLDTNVVGIFNVTRAVVAHMISRRTGKIINVSSVNGSKGAFGQTNYSAAKAGMHGFTKALALEVAVPPEGETMYLLDGEILAEPPSGAEARAFGRLEELGAARFQAFVARADRLEDGRWELTVDPL